MAGVQNTTLRIPDQWSAAWFREFVVQNLAKADVRNAIGDGVTITSNGNSVATISTSTQTGGAIGAHNSDPLSHAEAFATHRVEENPHNQYRLPVGSIFLTIGNTNPATLLGYGTWTRRAVNLALRGAP